MKNLNRIFKMVGIAAGLLAVSVNGYSWGQKGHDVTCAIAEKHLTKKANKKISEILDGKSIVYWANWMDNASHTPEYKHTSTWHYKNIDADETFENAKINEKGDVIRAVEEQIEALKSGKLNKEEQGFRLNSSCTSSATCIVQCTWDTSQTSEATGGRSNISVMVPTSIQSGIQA